MVLEWELITSSRICNTTKHDHSLNTSTIDCGNGNLSQCLKSKQNFQITTSAAECARACMGQASRFMFGTNDSDISWCNSKGCICSCAQNISAYDGCNKTVRDGFQTYQFFTDKRGRKN